ncbi:MAG: hypothetical protein GWO16_11820 [Gammaproteobacteria bacterium]|nr:hypothetical protein [Gammaproteobacteria bacterium]NIR98615.1 hypothetical protein [Gammaproteobacteria bacterium]NIT64338.1 hypothetical protein [Gammaproteobacteria bacterium]NIV21262.1 hypothetical protein [Gammaproteobacteria bacterium]NIX10966.1 hypothetical protein [Gammaproteobacteria bacterium]
MHRIRRAALACAWLGVAAGAQAGDPVEVDQLRQQLTELQQEYEDRIRALESRLRQLEAPRPAESPSAPVASAATTRGKSALNPAVSVILNGKVNAYSRDPDGYALPGVQLGGEAGLAAEGLALDESELVFSANADDRFFGRLTAALHDHDSATQFELEEAFIDVLGLPAGVGLRAGRFFSDIGYLNSKHPHSWDFADAPLAYRAFLGEAYFDDGVQLRWLAPTPLFMEAGAELLRGQRFPAAGAANDGLGAYSAFVHVGGDVGVGHSWRVGLSRLQADSEDRGEAGGHDHGPARPEPSVFDGDSRLTIADVVWKWAPHGNPTRRNMTLQAEYLHRDEDGRVSVDDGAATSTYRGTQQGWYAQAVYQFRPRWRLGARLDRLSSSNDGSDRDVLADAGLLAGGHRPQRYSLMLDYARSEFSRLRLQYNRDESRPITDHQWTLQYLISLGAHGAHRF